MTAFFRTKRTPDEMAAALMILARGPDGMDEQVLELLPSDTDLAPSELRFELLALRVCVAYTAARFCWEESEGKNAALRQYIDKSLLVFCPEYEDLEAAATRLAERSDRYDKMRNLGDVESLPARIGAVFADFCGSPRDPVLAGAGAGLFNATLQAVVGLGKESRIV